MSSLNIQHLFNLTGKVALITGGSRGIGFMMAQGLLEAGARVYITARKADACQQAAQELSQFGECIAIASDISLETGREQLIACLQQKESSLDILINNAGASWGASFEDYPTSAFDKLMNLNVTSMFALTRDLIPMLQKRAQLDSPSRVINVGSIDALHVSTAHGTSTIAYSASKAAVQQLTKVLAVDLGPKHITVNAVAPGLFPSQMTAHGIKEHCEVFEKNSLLGRIGQPQEMAGIAVYLSSRAGAYTHGTIVNPLHV